MPILLTIQNLNTQNMIKWERNKRIKIKTSI